MKEEIHIGATLAELGVSLPEHDRALVVTDSNVQCLLPEILRGTVLDELPVAVIEAGEKNKTLDSATHLWREMQRHGLTRSSIVVNVGGGMVTDIGGFAAATFKRGVRFVNVATTLLGAVDASVGGKTGIDFDGHKNQVGVFAEPSATYVPLHAFSTLPREQLLSGFSEVLKTAYIGAPELLPQLLETEELNPEAMAKTVATCLRVKSEIVEQDPHEHGLRKVLNLGHTAGHAFESLALRRGRPVPHGIAIAQGLLSALILSHTQLDMPSPHIYSYAEMLRRLFPAVPFTCDDYPELLALMRADKKNVADQIRFTLLPTPGDALPDQTVPEKALETALDITRDLLGL